MQKHLDLVGILYMLAAGLAALVAVAVFILGLGALSIALGDGSRVAASVTGSAFLFVAVLLLAWGIANVWVGLELRRATRPLARLAGLAVAIVHLFMLPFGTALGVYGIWVLLHPEIRARFEGH